MKFATTVQATVKQAADTAVTLVQSNLPKALPKVTLPAMLKPAAPAKAVKRAKRAVKAKRVAATRTPKAVKRAKRGGKSATRK